jgi:hypothetical protein
MNIDNELSSALCDMYDIRRALPEKIQRMPKDNEGSDYTIGECVEDVILFLENLQKEIGA